MYAIHTTPGFIIESRPSGEAGKLLAIFTRDLGLVWAIAQGIRLEKSKLRYHSQDYSFGEFSFVRGKEFWRLTNVSQNDFDFKIWKSELISRIALLLRRLLHGEESHPELFEHVESSLLFVNNTIELDIFSAEQIQTLESVIVFRILHLLGYVGIDKTLDSRIISEPFSIKLLDEITGNRMNMNKHINKALRESHL